MARKETTLPPSRSILIVDQESAIVDLLVEILTDEGYATHAAPDGAGALLAIARHRPALILLDVGALGLRGGELIEHVRAVAMEASPIVLMTTEPRDAVPLLALGTVACLTKPCDLGELLACVAHAMQPARRLD